MDRIMLIVAICNCVISLFGLILRIYEIRQQKDRS